MIKFIFDREENSRDGGDLSAVVGERNSQTENEKKSSIHSDTSIESRVAVKTIHTICVQNAIAHTQEATITTSTTTTTKIEEIKHEMFVRTERNVY